MTYKTKTHELILSIFREYPDRHFTVEEIYESLRSAEPASLATVYRQVNRLADEGTIQRIVYDSTEKACFQYKGCECSSEHVHMICERCGKMYHLDCDEVAHVVGHIESEHRFKIDPKRIAFYGLCADCQGEDK